MGCLIHRLDLKFAVIVGLFLLYFQGFFGRSPPDWINDIKIWFHVSRRGVSQVTRLLVHRITEHSGLLDPKFAVHCHILFAFRELGQQLILCFLMVFRDRCCRFNRFGISSLWFGLDEPERWFFRMLICTFLLDNVHIFRRRGSVDSPRLLAAVLVFIQSCSWDLRLRILHQIDMLLDVAIFALKQGKNGLVCRICFILRLLVPLFFCKHRVKNILRRESFHYLPAIPLGILHCIFLLVFDIIFLLLLIFSIKVCLIIDQILVWTFLLYCFC